MKQFNPYEFYTLATSLRPLANMEEGKTVNDMFVPIWTAKTALFNLSNGKPLPLPVARPSAVKLWFALDAIVPNDSDKWKDMDWAQPIPPYTISTLKTAVTELETVLSAELTGSSVYLVSKHLIYDTSDLIDRAENALGEAVGKVSQEVIKDFNAAGRALAFELATGSGFHVTRAVEAILRDYHRLAMALPPSKPSPMMATCIAQLRAKGEDPKLMDILDHIRDLHRNTVMHPDAFLTMPEALRLFDIAKSAISAMSERIEALRASSAPPAAPGSAVGPPATTAHPVHSSSGAATSQKQSASKKKTARKGASSPSPGTRATTAAPK